MKPLKACLPANIAHGLLALLVLLEQLRHLLAE